MKKSIFAALGLAAVVGGVFANAPVAVAGGDVHDVCAIIAKVDRNRDGKLNIFEAKRAGKATFKSLNPDGDRTLEYDEVRGRIGPKTFAKYNIFKRRALDRVEYTRLVRDRFNAANTDRDWTIECDELHTKAGHRLLAVIWH